MFRALKADKDAYITNKFVDGVRALSGNTGIAGSLDLFKLYGITVSGSQAQTELSRILIHFDLDPLRELIQEGKVDTSHSSFKCHLRLKDVYGGQTTPSDFSVSIFPLSSSFDEGLGKDVAYYSDKDKCNFLSSSNDLPWFLTGCMQPCDALSPGDYITSSLSLPTTKIEQVFSDGKEDLLVDVTGIVSSTLSNELPDSGFRISFDESVESDNHTYFVKRFGSRHSFDETKHPKLFVRYDDSIQDDNANFYIDSNSNLFLYNYSNEQLTNILSSSQEITGSNCLILELKTALSGTGSYSLYFTGSQYSSGINFSTGIYSAPVQISSTDNIIRTLMNLSSSISFTPIWKSIDESISFVTGSKISARKQVVLSKRLSPRRYQITAIGSSSEFGEHEDVTLRVNIFDENSPIIKAQRLPVELPGLVVRNSYFAIRNISTNEYEIPFDEIFSSTRMSSDSDGMYFSFNTSALTPSNLYVVDVMLIIDGLKQKFENVSSPFKIIKGR